MESFSFIQIDVERLIYIQYRKIKTRRRSNKNNWFFVSFFFIIFFNYWDCENYQFRSKSVVNLHWTVNCLLLCYWGIETWFEIGCYFVNIENLYIVTIFHWTKCLKVYKLQLQNCKSVVYLRLWLIRCLKFIHLLLWILLGVNFHCVEHFYFCRA